VRLPNGEEKVVSSTLLSCAIVAANDRHNATAANVPLSIIGTTQPPALHYSSPLHPSNGNSKFLTAIPCPSFLTYTTVSCSMVTGDSNSTTCTLEPGAARVKSVHNTQTMQGFKPSIQAVLDAQKNAKYAISSLNFEDIPAAVKFLQTALSKLTSGSS
jgi:hypothetical protein